MKHCKKIKRPRVSLFVFLSFVVMALCAGLSSCEKSNMGDLKGVWEDTNNPGHRIRISGKTGTMESIGSSTSASYAPFNNGDIKVGDVVIRNIKLSSTTSKNVRTRAASDNESLPSAFDAEALTWERSGSSGPINTQWEDVQFTLNGNSITIDYTGAANLATGNYLNRMEGGSGGNNGGGGGNNSSLCNSSYEAPYPNMTTHNSANESCQYAYALRCAGGLSLSHETVKATCQIYEGWAKMGSDYRTCKACQ